MEPASTVNAQRSPAAHAVAGRQTGQRRLAVRLAERASACMERRVKRRVTSMKRRGDQLSGGAIS
jgi:hypothetical protein